MFAYDLNRTSSFLAPNKHLLGKGCVGLLGQEIKGLGGKRALIVTDPGIAKTGAVSAISDILNREGVETALFDRVEPEPPARIVDEASAVARQGGYDTVVGVGGGSSLDVAKGVALMATNEGRVLDYAGLNMFRKQGVLKVMVPTTAGTGSEATWVCVVTDESDDTKKSLYSSFLLPDLAVLDPALTTTMPPSVTADTGFDALVHAIESYVSVNRTPYTEIMAATAIRLIGRSLPIAYAKGGNMHARYDMLFASNLAGMAFTSSGLGATHGLAYPLGTKYHMAHGRSNALMLLPVMKFNRTANLEGYREIAGFMGERVDGLSPSEGADRAIGAVERMLAAVDISPRLSDNGVKEGDLPSLAEEALKQSRFFGPNPRDVTARDITAIYEGAF